MHLFLVALILCAACLLVQPGGKRNVHRREDRSFDAPIVAEWDIIPPADFFQNLANNQIKLSDFDPRTVPAATLLCSTDLECKEICTNWAYLLEDTFTAEPGGIESACFNSQCDCTYVIGTLKLSEPNNACTAENCKAYCDNWLASSDGFAEFLLDGARCVTHYAETGFRSSPTDEETCDCLFNSDAGPDAKCKDVTVQLDASGKGSVIATDINDGSSVSFDSGLKFHLVGQTTFNCLDTGLKNVTLMVEDDLGNMDTCEATITVLDNTPPTITCPSDVTVKNEAGLCTGNHCFDPQPMDNCPAFLDVTTNSEVNGNLFPAGANTVTVTVTDAASNSATCTFSVTVLDDERPLAICPIDISMSTPQDSCEVEVTFDFNETDNCVGATSVADPLSGSKFSLGTTPVTVTTNDTSSNTDNCCFYVNVTDEQIPIPTCPSPITVSNTAGQCDAVVSFETGATDNCGIDSVISSPASGSTFNVTASAEIVTVTATDRSKNSADCNFTVTVEDQEKPTPSCPCDITVSNTPAQCDAVVNFETGATDNCKIDSVTSLPASGTTFNVTASPETVTVTAIDEAGNTAGCTFTVTVEDDEKPIINCSDDIGPKPNEAGMCSATVEYSITAEDNCDSDVATSVSRNSGESFEVGTTIVTAEAIDDYGNSEICSFSITVMDEEPPVLKCPDITVSNTAGQCNAVACFDIEATDNCGIVLVTSSPESGSTFNVATYPETVNVTAVDGAGNTANCTFTVTVEDNIAPTASCTDTVLTVNLDTNGEGSVTLAQVDSGSNDNCAISKQLSGESFNCNDLGSNTVTLTVTDGSENTDTCTAEVTVYDTTAPTARCTNTVLTVNLDTNGEGSVTLDQVDTDSNDNCITLERTLIGEDFDCDNLESNTVTLNVTDGSGNTNTCTAAVTVIGDEQYCNVDCVVTWGIWSSCSKTCDEGQRNRTATITVPAKGSGTCPADSEIETCNDGACVGPGICFQVPAGSNANANQPEAKLACNATSLELVTFQTLYEWQQFVYNLGGYYNGNDVWVGITCSKGKWYWDTFETPPYTDALTTKQIGYLPGITDENCTDGHCLKYVEKDEQLVSTNCKANGNSKGKYICQDRSCSKNALGT